VLKGPNLGWEGKKKTGLSYNGASVSLKEKRGVSKTGFGGREEIKKYLPQERRVCSSPSILKGKGGRAVVVPQKRNKVKTGPVSRVGKRGKVSRYYAKGSVF